MKIKHLLVLFVIVGFTFSCYKDLGNYDYIDTINDFSIEMNRVYGSRKVATTYTIKPTVTQTHYEGTDNLRYSWFVSSSPAVKGNEVSTDDHISIEIDPEDAKFQYNYYIRLYLTDTITGATQMYPTELRIAKPYEGAWMILHQQEADNPRLASVEYVGDQMVVNNDAYYSETGDRLTGTGYSLGVHHGYFSKFGNTSICQFFLFTSNPEQSGMYAQDNKFELLANTNVMFPVEKDLFDPSDIRACCRSTGGGIIVSNGEVFQGSQYSGTMGTSSLKAEVANDSPDYNITHGTIAAHIFLTFDGLNNRFLTLYTRNNYWSGWAATPVKDDMGQFEYVIKHPENVQSIDLNNIGPDKEMVYLGPGYYMGKSVSLARWQRYNMYAFAVSKNIPRSYVFEFSSRGMTNPGDAYEPAPFPNYFVIDTPPGVTGSTPMTSSWEFNRVLFYAIENRVYKLDFASTGGLSTLIYQHPDAGAKVSVFKMARGIEEDSYTDELIPAARTLGVGFDMPDGSGEMVVLILSGSGKVEDGKYGDFPTIQRITHSDDGQKFGPIKDIAYI